MKSKKSVFMNRKGDEINVSVGNQIKEAFLAEKILLVEIIDLVEQLMEGVENIQGQPVFSVDTATDSNSSQDRIDPDEKPLGVVGIEWIDLREALNQCHQTIYSGMHQLGYKDFDLDRIGEEEKELVDCSDWSVSRGEFEEEECKDKKGSPFRDRRLVFGFPMEGPDDAPIPSSTIVWGLSSKGLGLRPARKGENGSSPTGSPLALDR